MSKGLHSIMATDTTGVEFTEPIRRFFEDHELMDCVFSNDEGEIGLIAVDDIVLDDLERVIDWDNEPEDSELSKFKRRVKKDLKYSPAGVHYRVY